MIKAVIFDMDGVLIDSEIVYLTWNLEFVKTKNPSVEMKDLYKTAGCTRQDSWSIVQQAVGNGQTWEELREEFVAYRNARGFQVDYREIFRPEARELLSWLTDKRVKIALASSTEAALIEKVLDVNGIRHYFQEVVSGEQFKRSKPDPEIYLYTAKRLGLSPGECGVIEDSTVGITAANRAGMTVFALIDNRFGFDQSLADYRVEHLKDVKPLIEKLL